MFPSPLPLGETAVFDEDEEEREVEVDELALFRREEEEARDNGFCVPEEGEVPELSHKTQEWKASENK